MSAVTLLILTAAHAFAEDDCQVGFERWAKLSKTRLRAPPPSDDRGACLESLAARKELLDGLARNRAICDGTTSWLDQSPQQTKAMIDINENFIRSLGICPKEERAAVGVGWDTKLQVTAAPKPVPAAKPIAATRDCLDLEHAKDQHYSLVNRHCTGQTVLAVVEMRDAAGKTACRAYSVSGTVTVGKNDTATLKVNHECVLNHGSCTSKHVGIMFPECDW